MIHNSEHCLLFVVNNFIQICVFRRVETSTIASTSTSYDSPYGHMTPLFDVLCLSTVRKKMYVSKETM